MFDQQPLEHRRILVSAMFTRVAQAYEVNEYQLAEQLGCDNDTIKQWIFQGEVPIELLCRCRMATSKTLDWLIDGKDHVPLTPRQYQQKQQQLLFHAIAIQANEKAIGANYGRVKVLLNMKANHDLKQSLAAASFALDR